MIRQALILVLMTASLAICGEALTSAVSAPRDARWPAVRNAYISSHSTCAACGHQATTVHHVIPFHLSPSDELNPTNLISLCDRCHFLLGHLCDWRAFNPTIRADSSNLLFKIQHRQYTLTNSLPL